MLMFARVICFDCGSSLLLAVLLFYRPPNRILYFILITIYYLLHTFEDPSLHKRVYLHRFLYEMSILNLYLVLYIQVNRTEKKLLYYNLQHTYSLTT